MRRREIGTKWADVDLGAIAHNVRAVRKRVGAGVQTMAVVKANAYGHGAVPVARTALRAGAGWLGVSSPEEAMELRRAGIAAPLLNLGFTPVAALADLVRHDVSLTLWDSGTLAALQRVSRAVRKRARVHLKVDTGMGRLGIRPEEAPRLAEAIAGSAHAVLEGLFTHLADADRSNPRYTERQLDCFDRVRAAVAEAAPKPFLVHAANSAAVLRYPRAHYHLVRPGLLLYGAHPVPGWSDLALRAALTVQAVIAQVKEVPAGTRVGYSLTWTAPQRCLLATVAAGYADGMSRRLSNRGHVLIRGRRCAIVGRVSMDQVLVDVTAAGAAAGETAVLLGRQGNETLTVDEVAAAQETISWEVLCAISARIPRRYSPAGAYNECGP